MALTMEELENMQGEINWSGTAGFNIHSQKQLVDEFIELRYREASLEDALKLVKASLMKSTRTEEERDDLLSFIDALTT